MLLLHQRLLQMNFYLFSYKALLFLLLHFLMQYTKASFFAAVDKFQHMFNSLFQPLGAGRIGTACPLSNHKGQTRLHQIIEITEQRTPVHMQFLRQFAVRGEVMRLSEDEFDNVF